MEIVTESQLAEILGIIDEDFEDWLSGRDVVQVCAGDWIRIDENHWTFKPDPEWDA